MLKSFNVFCLAITSAVLVLGMFAGCDRDSSETTDELPDGELVYDENFNDEELGEEWQIGTGDREVEEDVWQLVDGTLHVRGAYNSPLWLHEPLPEAFRVSFSARSESSAGDIKFEILGDGKSHESGYIGIFGGWNNSLNIIARLDEHGGDRHAGAAEQRVERGRTYEMDVVRTDNRLRWYVDGELFLTFDDGQPLRGDEHRYFAFNNWEVPLYFDDLRIYDLGADDDS